MVVLLLPQQVRKALNCLRLHKADNLVPSEEQRVNWLADLINLQSATYNTFRSIERLRVFLLPSGWHASLLLGCPSAFNSLSAIAGWRKVL